MITMCVYSNHYVLIGGVIIGFIIGWFIRKKYRDVGVKP